MNEKAKNLAERLAAFNAGAIAFVEGVRQDDWTKPTEAENWPAGVTARHIGAGHYGILPLARMIVAGEPLPDITMDAIVEMGNEHARNHAGCTREEVISVLREQGEAVIGWVADRTDEELYRKAHFPLFGKEVSAFELIEAVVLVSGQEHLDSLKKTLAG